MSNYALSATYPSVGRIEGSIEDTDGPVMRKLIALIFSVLLLASPAARADYLKLGTVLTGFADDPEVHDPVAQGYALGLVRAALVLCTPSSDPDMVPIMEGFAQEMATKIMMQPELFDSEPMTGVLMFLTAHYDLDAACINNYFGAG